MSSITVDASDVFRLAARMGAAPRIVQTHLVKGVDDAGKIVEGTAKGTAPVVTGEYRRNITSRAAAVAGGAVATVKAGAPHSRWVEEGRGEVVPVRAKVLRFTVGGRVVFARRVGPARAQRIMRKALEANRSRIRARLQRAGRDAANELLGGAA